MRGKFSSDQSRRTFINKIAKGALAYSFVPDIISKTNREQDLEFLKRTEKYSANDQIQIGLIQGRIRRTLDDRENDPLIFRRRQFLLGEHIEGNHQ